VVGVIDVHAHRAGIAAALAMASGVAEAGLNKN
jgi:hypothetical protein